MRNQKTAIILGLSGCMLAFIAIFLFYMFKSSQDDTFPPAQKSIDYYPSDEIILAFQPITQGTKFVVGSIGRRAWVGGDPPPEVINSEAEALDKIATKDIMPGQGIVRSMFIDPNQKWLKVNCFSVTEDVIACYQPDQQYIYGIERATAQEKWRIEAKIITLLTVAAGDTKIYFWGQDKQLYAIDRETGIEQWKFARDEVSHITGYTRPNIIDGTLLFWNEDNKMVYALEAETGQEKWRFSGLKEMIFGPKVEREKEVSYADGEYWYTLNLESGEEIRRDKQ